MITIGIDGNEANVERPVGVSVYTLELLKYFAQTANDEVRFRVYLRAKPLQILPAQTEFFTYKVVFGPIAWLKFFLPVSLFFEFILHKLSNSNPALGVFFSPAHYAPPWLPCPLVVTIHDMAYKYFPEEFLQKDLFKLENWTRGAITASSAIITVSKKTQDDVVHFFPNQAEKITVVHNGFNLPQQPNTEIKEKILTEFSLKPDEFLLYVGTLQPRKNLNLLLDAFAEFSMARPHFKLVIAGKRGWLVENFDAKLKTLPESVVQSIVLTGFVTDEVKWALYWSAFCLVLPSRYEGFGLPILEAMASDCAVLAATDSAMDEIGGEAARYFDPQEASQLANQLEELVLHPEVKADMEAKGFFRTREFSWEACGNQTLAILTSVANSSK